MLKELGMRIQQGVHQWSNKIEHDGMREFYYTRQIKQKETQFGMGLPIKADKETLGGIIIILAIAFYIWNSAQQPSPTTQNTPRRTPVPTNSFAIKPELTSETESDQLNWDCSTISDAIPNAFRAALYAGDTKIVEPPPYKVILADGTEQPLVNQLPRTVHKKEQICVTTH